MNEEPEPLYDLLAALPSEEIRSWLLDVLRDEADVHAVLEGRIGVETQLLAAVRKLPPSVQLRFTGAVVELISEWKPDWGGDVIAGLVMIAARLRASRASSAIFWKIFRYRAHRRDALLPSDVADTLIAVLAGFAPEGHVVDFLERLFFDPELEPKWAATLLAGLCLCAPENLPTHLDRYIELASATGPPQRATLALVSLLQVITPPILGKYWPKFSDLQRQWLLESLSSLDGPEFRFVFYREPCIVWAGKTSDVVVSLALRQDLPLESWERIYEQRYQGGTRSDHVYLQALIEGYYR